MRSSGTSTVSNTNNPVATVPDTGLQLWLPRQTSGKLVWGRRWRRRWLTATMTTAQSLGCWRQSGWELEMGQFFGVGREGILVFMGTGSHDDCSLGSHDHVPSTQSRVSACHRVWGAPPTTLPSTNKHDMSTQTQVLIVKWEQEKNKSHCLETCLQTRILRETLNLAVDRVCPIVCNASTRLHVCFQTLHLLASVLCMNYMWIHVSELACCLDVLDGKWTVLSSS